MKSPRGLTLPPKRQKASEKAESHDANVDADTPAADKCLQQKKVENLERAIALHFMHCDYCRKYQRLGTTPAVAAGLADALGR